MVRSDRLVSTVANTVGFVLAFIKAVFLSGIYALRDATLWFVPVVVVLALLYPQPQLFTQPISHLTLTALVPYFAPPLLSNNDAGLYLRLIFKALFLGLWIFRTIRAGGGMLDGFAARRIVD